jgi:chemosensory pili system protein ChpA (sensor histidine kinase/response regulator)
VRQTARELEKQVELVVEGEKVDIDRSVLDKMGAPLEHLLRNAVAHGIELPKQRVKQGKPAQGTIHLKVSREKDEILVMVSDDGAGIHLDKVRQKAIEKQLIQADQAVTDQTLMSVIFEPGFSTASNVTQIAGRGVGLDAVRGDITGLGGRIDVTNLAQQGAQFSIYLPVTLSVIPVVMVRSGHHVFAVPAIMVEQLQKLKPPALLATYQAKQLDWAGNQYPIHYLPKLVGDELTQAEAQTYSPILLLRSGTYRVALHVDEVLGNEDVVMKPIGAQVARVAGVAGATVTGEGKIILILNPLQLANREALSAGAVKVTVAETPAPVEVAPLVMVVDDSLTMRKVLGRALEREGFQVITAKDGVDALQQLVDSKPDIMLLDIEMPRMDGFELTRNIRNDAATANIPIIIISSRTAEKHQNVAKELGVNAFLGKPVQDEQLLAEIKRQLKK